MKHLFIFVGSALLVQSLYSQKISESVRVIPGAINGVIIEKNQKKLVVYGDPSGETEEAEIVLFTHFRRDVNWAGRSLAQNGSKAIAPASENLYFTKSDSLWTDFSRRRFHNFHCQSTKTGYKPIDVHRFVDGGDKLSWQDIDFKILKTPGYTNGSVSYLADIDGKRFAFTGDLIYDDGKIFDLYSFQDSLQNLWGYHGYATRLGHLVSSLQLIASTNPDFLVPSRGPVITEPLSAIQKLLNRIEALYKNYLSISAKRWFFPDRIMVLSDHVLGPTAHVDWMPLSAIREAEPPSWLKNISTSRLVIAEDGSAFLIDIGFKRAYDNIVTMSQSDEFKSIEGIFVTHYHNDHVNFVNEAAEKFNCPVYATSEVKDILLNPKAYHMPVLSDKPVKELIIKQDGQKMRWKNFTLTFYYFPGQTIYHSAVLFEEDNGEAVFFIGDSFTPSGIDDYCLMNRNLLHPGMGYFYCLDFLKNMPGDILLANQHNPTLFAFSRPQLDHMANVLLERTTMLKDLFPWDNINYGIDEQWAKVYPYSLNAKPGQTIEFSVKIFNHSDIPMVYDIKPNIPDGFRVEPSIGQIEIEPVSEGISKFKLTVPGHISQGVSLVTVDIKFDKWDLREWAEGLIEVSDTSVNLILKL